MIIRAAVAAAFLSIAGPFVAAQPAQAPPSIEFGLAAISLGMTREQADQALRDHGRHLRDLNDHHTALVQVDAESEPLSDEGEIMLFLMGGLPMLHFSCRPRGRLQS
jgi:hypothetical protein